MYLEKLNLPSLPSLTGMAVRLVIILRMNLWKMIMVWMMNMITLMTF